MLTHRSAKLAVIHIAKRELELDDGTYRAILKKTTGVSSAGKIQYDHQYHALMESFRRAGWRSKHNHCTARQRHYIEALWAWGSRKKTTRSLDAMAKRISGVDNIRFLSRAGAQSLILALRDIARQSGYDPDKLKGAK